MSLLIKGGKVVFGRQVRETDILVKGETIAAVGPGLDAGGAEIVDAAGKFVLPGVIDVHTHMQLPFGGTVSADDFANGTKAAAFGGVTTIIDFAIQAKGESLKETVAKRRAEADGKVYIDYGLHVAVTDLTDGVMAEFPSIIESGCPSFKLFMTYQGLAVDDGTLYFALKTATEAGGMVGVHAENMTVIERMINKLLAEGKTAPMYHEVSRPVIAEAEAVSRAIMLAGDTGSRLYIFHLSSKPGLEKIREARQKGAPVFAETCPQYLLLSRDNYREPDFRGARYVMSPPLRGREDQEALWAGLADGTLQAMGSDHCPFRTEQKKLGESAFNKIPNGGPGTETILPLLYSEGVGKGRLTVERLAEVVSTGPAKLFGLYPKKGAILPGSDADLVIIDPGKEVALSPDTLHMNVDYTLYEGLKLKGYPVATVSKGRIICRDGEFYGRQGDGKFISRGKIDGKI
ncbi:MAG: dihydropyrimidinase [Desulfocucumaceae bacterium]